MEEMRDNKKRWDLGASKKCRSLKTSIEEVREEKKIVISNQTTTQKEDNTMATKNLTNLKTINLDLITKGIEDGEEDKNTTTTMIRDNTLETKREEDEK